MRGRGVGGRPTNAIDDAAVSKYHNNRSLINICTNRGRSVRGRRARGAAAPGIPALAVGARAGRSVALAGALLLRHDVDEVDLHPRADPIVGRDDMPIIPLPVGEAAAAGLWELRFIAAAARLCKSPSLRSISCGRARETGRRAAPDIPKHRSRGPRAAGSRASRAARRSRAQLPR